MLIHILTEVTEVLNFSWTTAILVNQPTFGSIFEYNKNVFDGFQRVKTDVCWLFGNTYLFGISAVFRIFFSRRCLKWKADFFTKVIVIFVYFFSDLLPEHYS